MVSTVRAMICCKNPVVRTKVRIQILIFCDLKPDARKGHFWNGCTQGSFWSPMRATRRDILTDVRNGLIKVTPSTPSLYAQTTCRYMSSSRWLQVNLTRFLVIILPSTENMRSGAAEVAGTARTFCANRTIHTTTEEVRLNGCIV